MSYNYTGYHGTDCGRVKSIKSNGFRPSANDDDWLGQGVYFFIEGVSDPKINARVWACCQAYDRKLRTNTYDRFTVLTTSVGGKSVLDTTTNQGLASFNLIRDKVLEQYLGQFDKRFPEHHNRLMWDLVSEMMGADVVVHNLYIKDYLQRKAQISSNVPNTTVMCVKDPTIIDRESIKTVDQGSVAKWQT